MASEIQRHVFITGRVQGVGYRAWTYQQAKAHASVRGWVRNLPDGRVEAVFAGPSRLVLDLVAGCQHGPTHAEVSGVEVLEESVDPGLRDFEIRR